MNILSSATSAPQLGIYVPAYKSTFLRESLASICAQTDQRFNLYVGDDASPQALKEVVSEFTARRPVSYHRFDVNLGGRSLAKQWSRCLALGNEPWVWLFADDDVMDPQCVSRFYEVLAETGGSFDVYRFNHRVIQANGQEAYPTTLHPKVETGLQFACARLQGVRYGFAQELVLSRRKLVQIDGFVEFPLAWAADDATLILMAGDKGIRTIPGPKVHWRLSGQNLSSMVTGGYAHQKAQASALFVAWLLENLPKLDAKGYRDVQEVIFRESRDWYRNQIESLPVVWSPADMWRMSKFGNEMWGEGRRRWLGWLLRVGIRRLRRRARNSLSCAYVNP